ncbi:MAG: hypothetical protein R3E87_20275 [Burkholderiaceae bacterium]
MYVSLATPCFFETVDLGAFGGPPMSLFIMAIEYIVYLTLAVYLLRSPRIAERFSIREAGIARGNYEHQPGRCCDPGFHSSVVVGRAVLVCETNDRIKGVPPWGKKLSSTGTPTGTEIQREFKRTNFGNDDCDKRVSRASLKATTGVRGNDTGANTVI